jgi:site-specific DNA-adenine methylase
MSLRPFFSFYGGKWRVAKRYPAPRYDVIIEPFAGSAGYALRHHDRAVILIEEDPTIAALWSYLITADPARIRALPDLAPGQRVTDLRDLTDPEQTLIGFWLNRGTARPSQTPSAWMRGGTHDSSFWGAVIRERIASQVPAIRHWQIITGSYARIDTVADLEATWFIDPPYAGQGKHYRFGSSGIDYARLGMWCRHRRGQVIVCEQQGAAWLPFQPFLTIKANESRHGKKRSHEVIWTNTAIALPVAA